MKFYDNTRLGAFKTCPRKYYFRHVLHWTHDVPEIALAFGTGWHSGQDVLWTNGTPEQATDAAVVAMEAEGINFAPLSGFDDFRTPGVMRAMLTNYYNRYQQFLSETEVLEIEKPFAVPLGMKIDTYYVGRMDKVYRERSRIYTGEHKTTSAYAKKGYFRDYFLRGFIPNSQIDGYQYAGHIYYGDNYKGAMVDAALVHKTVHNGFKRIPIERTLSHLDQWLEGATYWADMIEAEMDKLVRHLVNPQVRFLPAFPQNTNACQNFMRSCTYRDICRFREDPSQLPAEQTDFTVKKWEPFSEEELKCLVG